MKEGTTRSTEGFESALLQEYAMNSGRIPAHEEDPRETPADDPRQETDWPNTKQTDEPWNGNPEKEQRSGTKKSDPDQWQETNTH